MPVYYVDTAGSDAATGLTTIAPWQTMGKVNGFAFAAGDTILFKRGQTWANQLTPVRSGISSAWITYGAFGSGARPIINGSVGAVGACLINAPYHHLRFESIDFTGSTAANYSTVNALSHDLFFYDCDFRNGQYFGYQGWSVSGAEIYNQTVSHCNSDSNHNSGITISSNTGVGGPHDCLVEYCVSRNNGTDLWADHGIYCRYGVTIRYNECYNNFKGAGIKVNSETISNSAWDPVVYGNKCYNNFIGMYCANVRTLAYNNLFYGNEHNVDFDGDSGGVQFVFNTILNAATVITGAEGIRVFSIANNFTGAVIKNNLIIQDRAVSANVVWRTVGTARLVDIAAYNDIDYNVYYTDALVATNIFTDAATGNFNWTAWLAYTGTPDGNSTFLLALPGLISRYSNVGLVEGSNVYGRGLAVAGITTDKAGIIRPNPPSPGWVDLAAYIPSSGALVNLGRVIGMSGLQADVITGSCAMAEIRFAYATDTSKLGIYVGGAWRWVTVAL